jgi:hypothetical protein
MSFEEIDRVEESSERGPRRPLAVQEAAEILGVGSHALRDETEGLDPAEPAWACAVPLDEVLEIQELR